MTDINEGKRLDAAKEKASSLSRKYGKKFGAIATAANIATLGGVTSNVGSGEGNPKDDMLAAATTAPRAVGYVATAAHYGKKAWDKYNEKDQKNEECWKHYRAYGVKEKGNRMVPNCVHVEESEALDKPTPSAEQIAKKFKKPLKTILAQINKGAKKESEHTSNKKIANEIARDHVNEMPDYYDKAERAGLDESNKLNKLKKRDWQDPKKRPKEDDNVSHYDPRDMLSSLRRQKAKKEKQVAEETLNEENSFAIKNKKTKVTIATFGTYEQAKQKLKSMDNKKEFSIYKLRHKGALHNRTVNESNPRTLGAYIHFASKARKRALEDNGPKPDMKTWSKRHEGIKMAKKKLLGQAKVDPVDPDDPPFKGGHKRSHEKSSTHAHKLAVKGMKMQKEDTNEIISEALLNMADGQLNDMKENFMLALQEKAIEALNERKAIIAENYFAQ